MKKLILFYLVMLVTQVSNAQKKVDARNDRKYFEFVGNQHVDIRTATPRQLKIIERKKQLESIAHERYNFSIGNSLYGAKQNMAIRFQSDTKSKVYQGNNWSWGNFGAFGSFIIDGTADVEFADVKITKENAKNYRYHVVTNDSKEIIGWTIPNEFKTTSDGKASYAYLGSYSHQPNGYLKIEIYNTQDYRERDAMVVDWRPIVPAKISAGVEYLLKRSSDGPFYASLDFFKGKRYVNFIETDSLGDRKFILGDSLVRIVVDFGSLNYSYKAELVRRLNKKNDRIDLGNYSGQFHIYKEFWKEPGEYEIILTPKLPTPGGTPTYYLKDKSAFYKFTVLPAKNEERLFSKTQLTIFGIIMVAVFGAILGATLTYIKKREAKKLAKQYKEKEIAKLELDSVRSQLNPHFLFNALAGIQNLMNKNEIDNANRYLTKFARLTRNVLERKELISLTEEKAVLDDYMEMEQLRFGFHYKIDKSADLDSDNIEIPAMLLQPFLENAVKHGISEKGLDGKIEIHFNRRSSDLVLSIKDNGGGFNAAQTYHGLGLTLSKNRISLLNTIYKDTPFILDIQSNPSGTIITITLTRWL